MKIVDKVKLIEQKTAIYVADDGTEFLSEIECIRYESNNAYNNTVKSMKTHNISFIDFTIPFWYSGAYYVNSIEELNALITYFSATFQVYNCIPKRDFDGPGWYLTSPNYSGDHDMIEITSYKKIIAEFKVLTDAIENINDEWNVENENNN